MIDQLPALKKATYKIRTDCRVCGGDLSEYINLGNLPLSNNLCSSPVEHAPSYPLKVMLCSDCGLSQLSIVIDPQILFGHYVYRSSINKGYVQHCRQMARDLQTQYGINEKSFMVDIAGNDGALLREFKSELGLSILNVDPAENLGAICEATGIPTLVYFWGNETARRVLNGFGQADLITATNVFAHVDDVYDFIEGVKILLKPGGVCILEFPYLLDFIRNNEFDTIYFEHLSYFSIRPLVRLCDKLGLSVMKVEDQQIHGGSVRVHIGQGPVDKSVKNYMLKEFEITRETYQHFAESAHLVIREFSYELNKLRISGAKIAGFAASAKGNTLLNCAHVNLGTMKYIVDETPEKIGKYSPGTHIPIVSMLELQQAPPDYLVILSWNFAEEIKSKCRSAGYKGKFIIPIPNFQILD